MKNVLRSTVALFALVLIVGLGSDPAHAVNNALDFDGTNDYVNVPDSDVFDFTSFTVEAWIYPTAQDLADNHAVIGKSNVQWLPASTGFSLENASTVLYGSVWDASGNQKYVQAGTLAAGIWQHVAMSWTSGGSLILYINGNYVGQQSSTFSGSIANAGSLKIGSFTWILGRWWSGHIDEVRIWNDVRTQSEIRANMYQEISDPSSETNLVAYYKFNETSGTTLTDSKGSNNGALTNMSGNEWFTSPAMFGPKNGLDFDGTNDYVEIPSQSYLNTENFSVEFWMKMTSRTTNGWGGIADHGNYHYSEKVNYNWCFLSVLNQWEILFGIIKDDGNGSELHVNVGQNIWHHVAGTYDGTTMSLYLDGVLVDTMETTMRRADEVIRLGRRVGTTQNPNYFGGEMDEFRVWNTVRTPTQIRDNMCKVLTSNESGLVGYYNFDNASGTTLQDFSNNGNDGTLHNMDDSDWVSSSPFNTWLNTGSSSWSTAANWSRGSAPGSSDNVGIYSYTGGTDAAVSGSPEVNHMVLGSSSSMALSSGLTVSGNLIVEADLDLSGQTITLGSSGYLIEDDGRLYGETGSITTTRTFGAGDLSTAQNIAGLGAELKTDANMDSTVITPAPLGRIGLGSSEKHLPLLRDHAHQ